MDLNDLLDRARALHLFRTEAALLRAVRELAGLTQQQVADALGVTRVAVTNWERGFRTPSGKDAGRYISVLARRIDGFSEYVASHTPAGMPLAIDASFNRGNQC